MPEFRNVKNKNIFTYFSNGGKKCYALHKDFFSVPIYC